MSEACRTLGVPVISGNVSFYNETEGHSIHPTPTIGTVRRDSQARQHAGGGLVRAPATDSPARRGSRRSSVARHTCGCCSGSSRAVPPAVDSRRRSAARRSPAGPDLRRSDLRTAHDLAEGGLAVAMAEACFARGLGADIRVALSPVALFSETQGRALVACSASAADEVLEAAEDAGVAARDMAGEVVRRSLCEFTPTARLVEANVEELRQIWKTALPHGPGALTMCGIFGIERNDDAANLAYLGLYALQHRGQESAGIVGLGRRPDARRARHGAGERHLQGAHLRAAARAARHRPHPLLDGRQRA